MRQRWPAEGHRHLTSLCMPCVWASTLNCFPLFLCPPVFALPRRGQDRPGDLRSPLPKQTTAKTHKTSQRRFEHRFRCARTQRWKNRRCNIQMSDQSLQEGRGWKDWGLDLGDTQAQMHAHTCTLQPEAKWIYYLRTVDPDGWNKELQINAFL